MADVKEIAVTASVDIGKNITELVEKLAHQIGTTADKVFPWYVKQQVVEGVMFFALDLCALLMGMVLFFVFLRKADFTKETRQNVFTIIGGIIMAGAGLILLLWATDAATKILNPNFFALKAMTGDMAKLLGK